MIMSCTAAHHPNKTGWMLEEENPRSAARFPYIVLEHGGGFRSAPGGFLGNGLDERHHMLVIIFRASFLAKSSPKKRNIS